MAKLITADEYCKFVSSKIRTPYVYGAKGKQGKFTQSRLNSLAKAYPKNFSKAYIAKAQKFVGQVCCDCSGLVCWPFNFEYGSAQLYSKAYARLPMSKLNDFAPGVVLWKSGHVGVYVGKDEKGRPICVEEKGIDYGCVSGVIDKPSRWTCGLTFTFIDYDIEKPIPLNQISYKKVNPYKEPTGTVSYGMSGESVCWIQTELVEAGYGGGFTYAGRRYSGVNVDGKFGPTTYAALKAFQASSKLTVDGICGPVTRAALIAN